MRCRFAHQPEPASELCARAAFDAGCARFFSRLLSGASKPELNALLCDVDAELELLRVRRLRGEHWLDLRGDPTRRLRLERMSRAAPARVNVVVERGPQPFAAACREVAGLTGVPVDQARVRAGITRGHLLDLVVYLPRGAPRDVAAEAVAEMVVDACLGERMVDDWVHTIRAEPLLGTGPLKLLQVPEQQTQSFPLAELCTAVDNAVTQVRQQLPDLPLCQVHSRGDWLILEADGGVRGDDVRQADLIMASTCMPEMLKCFLTDAPFASYRFSNHGERFVYLKYQDRGPAEARVRARQELEDALEEALRPHQLGCVVGNGVGTINSYIDMALLDLDRGLDTIGAVARARGLPTASWILFCDSEWGLEWVGIWPETPEPVTEV